MKKTILLIFASLFFILSYGQNKTYWKKKFNNGTLYLSVVKSDSKFGPHIREYFTGRNEASLFVIKYSSSTNKYKLQMKNGWSSGNYVKFGGDGKLIYATPQMGVLKLDRIDREDIPAYIREDTYFKRRVVTD